MGNTDPILTALAGMEERILQAVGDQLRDFRLEVNGRFDSLEHRMARLSRSTRCSRWPSLGWRRMSPP